MVCHVRVALRTRIRAAMLEPGVRPLATYYPGAGQYWLAMRAPLPG